MLRSVSLPDDAAHWMTDRLDSERKDNQRVISEARSDIQQQVARIDKTLDRLTVAYLDAGALSAAEFRKRKQEFLVEKR